MDNENGNSGLVCEKVIKLETKDIYERLCKFKVEEGKHTDNFYLPKGGNVYCFFTEDLNKKGMSI